MKTSKIIFTSLLVAIALVILAGFIEVRLTGNRKGIDLVVKKRNIPSFKVLCINNSDIHLSYGDSSFLAVTSLKDSLLSQIEYKLSNDTLRISNIRYSYSSNVRVEIHSSDSLQNILLVNSDLRIDHYGSKNLTLGIDKSNVFLNRDEKEQFTFHSLDIMAKNNSAVYSDAFKADNLKIFLEKSSANLDITALKLNGNLSDSSSIYTLQSDDISLKKDSTSKIIVNN
jgi:hypothetical protein